ncbi:MAG: hypothetical protein ACHQ53_04730, partial [Polyangiales bacterium]
MRTKTWLIDALSCVLVVGCSSSSHGAGTGGAGSPSLGSSVSDKAAPGVGGQQSASAPVAKDSGTPKDGGPKASSDAASPPDAGTSAGSTAKAGNPDGKCSQALPQEAQAVDASHPTTVVGTGTVASCTFAALSAAIAKAGVITFDCGAAPATIAVTTTLELPTDKSTVIDGGNKVTLDGGGAVRILSWNSGDWQKNTNTLTLQHLTLANGKASGTTMIPMRPAPCSQGYNDGQGGALNMRDGSLRAIDVTFLNNQAAELGPDTGGGAIYLQGCKPIYIASCTFKGNKASNAGAMGSLFATDFIYDSLFDGNAAIGHGANNDDASMCSFMNNGQNEIGSGGNGGAIYNDGVAMDVTICGTQIRNNTAGAFGAAVFFTSNDQSK